MGESGAFSLASKLLSMIASPEFEMKWSRKRLQLLKPALEGIQSVLLDAEKKRAESEAVENWVRRVSASLDDLEHLFDEFLTDSMFLKNRTKETHHSFQKVHHFISSKLNPFVPSHSFTSRVKATTKALLELSVDSKTFGFVRCHFEQPVIDLGTGEAFYSVDQEVVGMEEKTRDILNYLLKDSDAGGVSVIGITGMGGMGKTTFAQLIYNNPRVQRHFDSTWWVTLGGGYAFREVFGKIFQSISGRSYHHHNLDQQRSVIASSTTGKYLLVLDDVWVEDQGLWSDVMRSLSSTGATGSKVMVTSRSRMVFDAMRARMCYELRGMSDDEAWDFFQRIAFTQEQKNDEEWRSLGIEILRKVIGGNVPLILKTVAALLRTKTTKAEWEDFKNENMFPCDSYSILSRLKLSYDHLSSNLKPCFAYCSLFPVNRVILKEKLVYLWIAQGYIKPGNHGTLEAAADAYFMHLFNRCFFQEEQRDHNGDITSCKMHDFMHDLAQYVSGSRTRVVLKLENEMRDESLKDIQHLSISYEIEKPENIPLSLYEADQLRSFFMFGNSCSSLVLDQVATKCKFLRVLDLHGLNIDQLPDSVGELKYLRYLDLSQNSFTYLPDSITMLVNLLTLDLRKCHQLEALPTGFRKLISLRHLDIGCCDHLRHMPPGFGELTSLVHLSDFKVSKRAGGNSKSSGLEELAKMNLRKKLTISYDHLKGAWRSDEFILKCDHIPETMKVLTVQDYPSMRIPCWWKETGNGVMSSLQHLVLIRCKKLKHLPPLNHLPELKILQLYHLQDLEYIDENEAGEAAFTDAFFPSLIKLELLNLPKLEGWSRGLKLRDPAPSGEKTIRDHKQPQFDHLSHLEIKECHLLRSMPPSPCLQILCLESMKKELVQHLVSACIVSSPSTSTSSSTLQDITIGWCVELTNFPGEGLNNLRRLNIRNCPSLKKLQLAPNSLEEITISNCPGLDLCYYREEEERGVDWHCLTRLRLLNLDDIPEKETLPECIRQLITSGQLQIEKWD